MGKLLSSGAILTLAFTLTALPAMAMEFNFEREPGLLRGSELTRIKASGEIAEGDDKAFLTLVTNIVADAKARSGGQALYPTVEFNSPGGNLQAGVSIGSVIRKFNLPTFVPREAICGSACTFAFLGGTERYVEGAFAIHAASLDTSKPSALGSDADSLRQTVDDLQYMSIFLVAYTREMVGRGDMAEAALTFGSTGTARVTDNQLRDWNVITHANRPSQRFPAKTGALSNCADTAWLGANIAPRRILCDNLIVAREFTEIESALDKLAGKPLGADVRAEQAKFEAYWESCTAPINLPATEWSRRNEECMKGAFDARSREVKALLDYYSVGDSEPAKGRWKRQR